MERNGYWSRAVISRRRVMRGAAALGLTMTGAALIGCGAGPKQEPAAPAGRAGAPAAPAAGTPKRGGTFIFPSSANVLGTTDLDPHTAPNTGVMQIWQSISRGLLQIDAKTNTPAPDLAKTVEYPDPLKINLTLHDATWENKAPVNGRKLTANDVKFSLDRIRSNKPGFTRGATIAALDRIEVVDDKHVTLILKRPSVSFTYGLSFGLNVIVAPEVVDKFKDLKSPQAAIGVGPFAIESFEPNVQLTLARRADSWMGERPYVDKVKYINIIDTAAGVAAYRSGQIHTFTVPPDEAPLFKRDLRNHTFQEFGSTNRASFTLRHDGAVAWAKDLRVRQALNLAIDRPEAVQVLFAGQGQPVGTIAWVLKPFATPPEVLATYPGYKKDKAAERAEAVKLLQAAGQEKLSPELLSSGTTAGHVAIAQFLQDQLKRVGVIAKLELIEYTSYKKRVDDMKWETTGDPFSSGYNPDEHLRLYHYTGGSRNYGKYSNPEMDKMIDDADQEFDAKKRAEIMYRAQKHAVENVANAWLGSGVSIAASHPFVKGYAPTGEYPFTFRWENIWLENA